MKIINLISGLFVLFILFSCKKEVCVECNAIDPATMEIKNTKTVCDESKYEATKKAMDQVYTPNTATQCKEK